MKSGLKALARNAPWRSAHQVVTAVALVIKAHIPDTLLDRLEYHSRKLGGYLRWPASARSEKAKGSVQLVDYVQGLENDFTGPSHLGAQCRMIIGSHGLCPIT